MRWTRNDSPMVAFGSRAWFQKVAGRWSTEDRKRASVGRRGTKGPVVAEQAWQGNAAAQITWREENRRATLARRSAMEAEPGTCELAPWLSGGL